MVLTQIAGTGHNMLEPFWSNYYDAVVTNFEYENASHM